MGPRQQSFFKFYFIFLAALPQRPVFGIARLAVVLATDSSTCTVDLCSSSRVRTEYPPEYEQSESAS